MHPEDVTEDEINRFIDGELPDRQRTAIQARLALRPNLASRVFAESQRMEHLRTVQPHRLFPPRESVDRAKRLESAFRRRKHFLAFRNSVAAAVLVALGWVGNSLIMPAGPQGHTVDENFILAAREALRVAKLDAGPGKGDELQQDKIERLVGAININMPQLPSSWQVTDVQVQPWNGQQSLVVTAYTPSLGQVTLVAAPMDGESAIPPTAATDGRVPTVYWQSGGTAYALMGPAAPERLEKEAEGIEVATRKNLLRKIRG